MTIPISLGKFLFLLFGRRLLGRRLAAPALLGRALGGTLVDELGGLLERDLLGGHGPGQRRVGRPVGDVGPIAALHDLDLELGPRMRAEYLERLARSAIAIAAGRRVGEAGDGGVHADL